MLKTECKRGYVYTTSSGCLLACVDKDLFYKCGHYRKKHYSVENKKTVRDCLSSIDRRNLVKGERTALGIEGVAYAVKISETDRDNILGKPSFLIKSHKM